MEKRLLLTISADKSALYGVRFVSDFFDRKDEMGFILFYTTAAGPSEAVMGLDKDLYLQQKKQVEQEVSEAAEAMEEAQSMLCRRGFNCDIQSMRLQHARFSRAVDIIQEAEDGLYDAVILGRRGVGWFETAMSESVSEQMLGQTFRIPSWFCRRPASGRENVLLCVDGSDQSQRIADHVGFMLAQEDRHTITLLHVQSPKGNVGDCDAIFEAAETELLANGVPEERIKRLVLRSTSVARTVLKEAQDKEYAVVAMGRTGTGRGLLSRLFMGSSSNELFRELVGASLWLSY